MIETRPCGLELDCPHKDGKGIHGICRRKPFKKCQGRHLEKVEK